LQEARNCGPFVILDRLHGKDWTLEDISAVIKLGFVGGGMDEIKARRLVKEYVEQGFPINSLPIAVKIIDAAVLGPPDEEPLEKKVVETQSELTTSQTEGSGSQDFMASVQ
jgi:Phage tail tube protein, GTA-gp10